MKTISILFVFVIVTLGVPTTTARAAQLLQPATGDQVPTTLANPSRTQGVRAAAKLERATVQVSRALDANLALAPAPKPFVSQSREFWTQVSESQLRAGVTVTTTAAGAVIRLSPVAGTTAVLDPDAVRVYFKGRELSAAEASEHVADAAALRRAGMPVARGTLAFKLAPSVGSGEIKIAAPEASGRYLIHVLDTDSSLVMNLAAARDTVLVGRSIRFRVDADDAGKPTQLSMVSGMLTAPDGYSTKLDFARNRDGSFSASFTPNAAHSSGPALWEAHAFGATRNGKLMVLRDGKTAFAVSAVTARLNGQADVQASGDDVRVHVGIEIASTSRYQLSGVLYGTGRDSQLHPAALAQSAAWLVAGKGTITLAFDAETLKASAMHAPFELRDLRLIDQASMHLIERRARALVIR